jgi:hypothetical protein
MNAENLYHAGVIVEDFEGSLAWYSEHMGYRWCEPFDGETTIVTTAGERVIPMHMTYSMNEPRLELIEAVPGTIWVPADSGIHHLGYWSDDVDADVAHLVAAGMSLDVTGLLPDGSSMWAYCSGAGRTRTELVSRALQPSLTAWFTSGRR